MCFLCDIEDGKKIEESTGVTRRLREQCALRGIPLAECSPEAGKILVFIQNRMLEIALSVLTHNDALLPYVAAALAAYADEFDQTYEEINKAGDR